MHPLGVTPRIIIIKKWLLEGHLDVYNLPVFYHKKLFFVNLISYFSKKFNIAADEIKLKFSLEKHENDQAEKNADGVYININGFVIENVGFDTSKNAIVKPKSIDPQKLPIIRVTFIKIEEDEEEMNDEIVSPIYDIELGNGYENIEPIGYISLKYDAPKKEDYWISKGVSISIDTDIV